MREPKVGEYWKFSNNNTWSIDLIRDIDATDGITTKVIQGCGRSMHTMVGSEVCLDLSDFDSDWTHLPAYDTPLYKILNGDNDDTITT